MLFKWLGFLGDSQFSLIVAEIPNSEGPNPQSQSTEKKTTELLYKWKF